MKLLSGSVMLLSLGMLSAPWQCHAQQASAGPSDIEPRFNPAAVKQFEQAVDRIENLQLPINKVVLYREAATALIPTDRPQAIALLKRALSGLDSAEIAMKAQGTLDDKTYQQMEFHRLPVFMLMERIDPVEALNTITAPQTGDHDTAFNTLFFERLHNPELVRQAALRKMAYGVTPAVVAAYGVLLKTSPEVARSLGTAIVLKLTKTDPASDPEAVEAAFRLVRLLRTDVGALAPQMVINPDLLGPDSVRDLFSFVGDAFLASKDPEDLILGSRPQLFTAALETYAPSQAQAVKLLPFAAPDARSKIFNPYTPEFDANHPDPKTLTKEQIERREAMKVQVQRQIKDSQDQLQTLAAKARDEKLTPKERDNAAFQVVAELNKALSLSRAQSTVFDREAFRSGELEFYSMGQLPLLVDSVSLMLQRYALKQPKVAEDAARSLDGNEIQIQVGLGIAIRKMTGLQPYLVPPDKPPAKPTVTRPATALPLGIAALPSVNMP